MGRFCGRFLVEFDSCTILGAPCRGFPFCDPSWNVPQQAWLHYDKDPTTRVLCWGAASGRAQGQALRLLGRRVGNLFFLTPSPVFLTPSIFPHPQTCFSDPGKSFSDPATCFPAPSDPGTCFSDPSDPGTCFSDPSLWCFDPFLLRTRLSEPCPSPLRFPVSFVTPCLMPLPMQTIFVAGQSTGKPKLMQ